MIKLLYWVGQSKKDLLAQPENVQDVFGYALWLAQQGKRHNQAKPDAALIYQRLKAAQNHAQGS